MKPFYFIIAIPSRTIKKEGEEYIKFNISKNLNISMLERAEILKTGKDFVMCELKE